MFLLLFLTLGLVSCTPLGKIPVRYGSSKLSGVFIDAETGKPVEGVRVQVAWRALRRTANEHNPDGMDIHSVTTTTDPHGVFTIPAWSRFVAGEWEAADAPIVSYSKAGYNKGYADGLSDGTRFSLTQDPLVKYGPLQSDDVIREKIKGVWTKTAKLANGYVTFTNEIGPSNKFSFLGVIFSTNGVQKETWHEEGTWYVRYRHFVKNAQEAGSFDKNYELSIQVLAEENVVHVNNEELILSRSFDGSISELRRIK